MDETKDGFLEKESLSSGEESVLRSKFFLDHSGEVVVTLDSNGLSWKLLGATNNKMDRSSCWGTELGLKFENDIKFSDVYAIEFINWGLIHESVPPNAGGFPMNRGSEMYRFSVHGFRRSRTQCSLWVLATYTFGHQDLQLCQTWVRQIKASLKMQVDRPKSLLVFVHPLSGKKNGRRTWETVAPIFSRAKVKTKVIVTERAGHALDVMLSIKDEELKSYDGVIAVVALETAGYDGVDPVDSFWEAYKDEFENEKNMLGGSLGKKASEELRHRIIESVLLAAGV